MISTLIKEGRVAKGFTQKELSGLSNVSVRSIQRIENGEIVPRSYTLKTLAEILGLSFDTIQNDTIQNEEPPQSARFRFNKGQKIILSIGIPLFISIACWAFIAQSSRFPETDFEVLALSACMLLIITVVLALIWRTRS